MGRIAGALRWRGIATRLIGEGQYENLFGGRISSAASAGRNGQLYRLFLSGTGAPALCRGPERLLLVTKWLYPDVAKQYGTNWKAVERNIRTVGRVIWNSNRPLLEDLARRELSQKPCTAQLLAILHASLLPSGSSTDEE